MSDAPTTDGEIREVNERYHDGAAAHYDTKWGIDYGAVGRAQVLGKLHKALGPGAPQTFHSVLEIGAGTGYFSLNLLQAGVIDEATCVDISPGMLRTLAANARRLGLTVETVAADAATLPLPDASFDLVLGHAVLHHLPDLRAAFAEFRRVLRPGGRIAFAGEPSRRGDRIAQVPKRVAGWAAPAWRAALRAAPAAAGHDDGGADNHELEQHVDVHAFAPADLERAARAAGFADVRVRGEELLANWFGWTNRTLEASADADTIPYAWREYAFRGYLLLQHVDRRVLERWLPPAVFYNLMIAARRPG
jgi:ubiquinone/menaquinone biosynthesis C-methylase UbiE